MSLFKKKIKPEVIHKEVIDASNNQITNLIKY